MYGNLASEQTQIDVGSILHGELRREEKGQSEGIRGRIGGIRRIANIDVGSVLLGAGTAVGGTIVERFLNLFSRE